MIEYQLYQPISMTQARARGFRELTNAYRPSEYGMMNSVIRDMERGAIRYALVIEFPEKPDWLSVWRAAPEKAVSEAA